MCLKYLAAPLKIHYLCGQIDCIDDVPTRWVESLFLQFNALLEYAGNDSKREWGLNRDVQTMWRAAHIFASFAYFKRRIIIWCYSTSLHSGGLAGTKWVWDHGVSIYIECCNSIGYICKVGDKWVVVVQRCHSLCRSSSCSSLAEFHLGVNDGFTKRVPVGIHLTSTIQLMQSHTQWLSLYELYR